MSGANLIDQYRPKTKITNKFKIIIFSGIFRDLLFENESLVGKKRFLVTSGLCASFFPRPTPQKKGLFFGGGLFFLR